jgi:hypothetical protein
LLSLEVVREGSQGTTSLLLERKVDCYLFPFTGILKVTPPNQQLFKENQIMEDDKTLQDYGLTSSSAKAQCPGSIGLAFR